MDPELCRLAVTRRPVDQGTQRPCVCQLEHLYLQSYAVRSLRVVLTCVESVSCQLERFCSERSIRESVRPRLKSYNCRASPSEPRGERIADFYLKLKHAEKIAIWLSAQPNRWQRR